MHLEWLEIRQIIVYSHEYMTQTIKNTSDYLASAQKTGLSAKASAVYVVLLDSGKGLAPKDIIIKSIKHIGGR